MDILGLDAGQWTPMEVAGHLESAKTHEMFERAAELQMAENQELAALLVPGHKATRSRLTDAERAELATLTGLLESMTRVKS